METHLYLDIETIPAQHPDILADIRASKQQELDQAIAAVRAPGNYGAEAAAKWMAEKGSAQIAGLRAGFDADVDDAYRKTSFDGAFGQICVIGWALNDDQPRTVHGMNERDVLHAFGDSLDIPRSAQFSTCVIGHNVAAFDLRFLAQRYIVNGIRPHIVIAKAAQAKPWEVEKVFDTMVQWSGVGSRISLDKLCKALGIKSPKGDIDGSKVWDAVQAGRLVEVADYCARDVEAVRQVHLRMTYQVEVV